MEEILLGLQNSYVLVIISIILGLLLMFIDARINKKNYIRQDYIKVSLLVFVISSLIVYIHTVSPSMGEEIITGSPPF